MRVGSYARFSTDQQNPRSTEDQHFEIRSFVSSLGWTIVKEYSDSAVSGTGVKKRTQYRQMIADARRGQFDCIIAEDLDRLSRRTRDLASFYDIMTFLGVQVRTISDGKVTNLHIGLKGTMSAEFLRGLSQKTVRGQSAAVRSGRLAGGVAYGYRPSICPGKPEIVPEEASVVRRIFQMRLAGHSPRDIAGTLNEENIPSPRGGEWNASTIHGCARKMTGIIRNELYIGKIIWNKRSYLKDPENECIVTKLNDKSKYVTADAPHLRIVDQELWDRVQEVIGSQRVNRSYTRSNGYLLSGLMKCGTCGGSYCSAGGRIPHFGCSSYRVRKSCNNKRLVNLLKLEDAILCTLKLKLLDKVLLDKAVKEMSKEFKRHSRKSNRLRPKLNKRLKEIENGRDGLLRLLEEGVSHNTVKDRLVQLEKEEDNVRSRLVSLPEPAPIEPLDAAAEYRNHVSKLSGASAPSVRATQIEVVTKVRNLIDHVVVYPTDDPYGRDIELVGDLALLFNHQFTNMVSLVAGVGFEPTTFRL